MHRHTHRAAGEDAFMEHLRRAPFTDADRDLLTTAERWINGGIAFLPVACFHSVFKGIAVKDAARITEAGFCLARATTLMYWSERDIATPLDRQMALGAFQLYMAEAQRLFGSLFPEGHPFWQRYYSRLSAYIHEGIDGDPFQVKRRYALIFLPADALHALSRESQQLEYELLLQSLGAVMMAVFGTADPAEYKGHLHQALRLANRLGLPAYDTWISDLLQNTENIQS